MQEEINKIDDRLQNLEERQNIHEKETDAWKHKFEMNLSNAINDVGDLKQQMKELLDNSRWLKRAFIKGGIALGTTVIGTLIVGIGALMWVLATQ